MGTCFTQITTSPSSRGRGLKYKRCIVELAKAASPSSRGRGLKYLRQNYFVRQPKVALFTRAWIEMYVSPSPLSDQVQSPSSRGRGLKCFSSRCVSVLNVSPSSRGRGLKFKRWHFSHTLEAVALFTRAWIEMYKVYQNLRNTAVALFTRAWIEIAPYSATIAAPLSPSSRGRGLKLHLDGLSRGSWSSPSSRGRGLKYPVQCRANHCHQSPSSRGRGLKLRQYCLIMSDFEVALFTRAWIEILSIVLYCSQKRVALFTRAWIEI